MKTKVSKVITGQMMMMQGSHMLETEKKVKTHET